MVETSLKIDFLNNFLRGGKLEKNTQTKKNQCMTETVTLQSLNQCKQTSNQPISADKKKKKACEFRAAVISHKYFLTAAS